MATEQTTRPLRKTPLFWSSIAGALLLGITWGLPANEPFLLEGVDDPQTEIPRMASGEAQYELARRMKEEEAWRSVALHFPGDRQHGRLAERELAEIFLLEDRRNEALEIFGRFERQNPRDSKFHAYGLAGQYVIMILDGDRESAFQIFVRLWPLREKLYAFSPQITLRVLEDAHRHNSELSPAIRGEIERRLKKNRASTP